MGIKNQENRRSDSAVRASACQTPHWARRENMANDLTKRAGPTAPKQADDAASRLKGDLMRDALGRMFGGDGEKTVPGTPRVILALANHAYTAGWDRAKVLQRGMFKAAAGSGLELKFAFYGADDGAGVRRCRITMRWITDPDDMADVM